MNYLSGADWNGQNGNVTTVGSAGSTSFYGAFDMNGNVWEWNETPIDLNRGLRGGSYSSFEDFLRPSFRNNSFPSRESDFVFGFRLASPVPTARLCADVNQDGSVTPTDFGAWLAAFNADDLLADANQNDTVEPTDFGAWLAAFNLGDAGPTCDP